MSSPGIHGVTGPSTGSVHGRRHYIDQQTINKAIHPDDNHAKRLNKVADAMDEHMSGVSQPQQVNPQGDQIASRLALTQTDEVTSLHSTLSKGLQHNTTLEFIRSALFLHDGGRRFESLGTSATNCSLREQLVHGLVQLDAQKGFPIIKELVQLDGGEVFEHLLIEMQPMRIAQPIQIDGLDTGELIRLIENLDNRSGNYDFNDPVFGKLIGNLYDHSSDKKGTGYLYFLLLDLPLFTNSEQKERLNEARYLLSIDQGRPYKTGFPTRLEEQTTRAIEYNMAFLPTRLSDYFSDIFKLQDHHFGYLSQFMATAQGGAGLASHSVQIHQDGQKVSPVHIEPEGAQFPEQSIVDIYTAELQKLHITAGEKIEEKKGGEASVSEMDQLKAMQKAIFEWRLQYETEAMLRLTGNKGRPMLTRMPYVIKVYETFDTLFNSEDEERAAHIFINFLKLHFGRQFKELSPLYDKNIQLGMSMLVYGVIQLDYESEQDFPLIKKAFELFTKNSVKKGHLFANMIWDIMPSVLTYRNQTTHDQVIAQAVKHKDLNLSDLNSPKINQIINSHPLKRRLKYLQQQHPGLSESGKTLLAHEFFAILLSTPNANDGYELIDKYTLYSFQPSIQTCLMEILGDEIKKYRPLDSTFNGTTCKHIHLDACQNICIKSTIGSMDRTARYAEKMK
ncbi:hypothetical protein DID73_02440 [Candidatus Marinamargulisbacteria bacterium SCGC AG-343-K17]|nr:hypothetical protein DID73_02440 [Candidatus Marinamargulisbacteria bacterium SCGC AG-343-K17]